MLRKASLCPMLPYALLCPNTIKPVPSPLRSVGEDEATRATPGRNLGSVPCTPLATAPPLNLPPLPPSLATWSMLQPEAMPQGSPSVGNKPPESRRHCWTGADNPSSPPQPSPRRTALPSTIRSSPLLISVTGEDGLWDANTCLGVVMGSPGNF